MPTIGPGISVGPGITTSYGVSQLGLVTDINTNSTLSYSPNQFAYSKDIGSWMVQYGANNATLSIDTAVTDSPAGGVAMKMAVTGTDPYTNSHNGIIYNISTAASGQTWTLSMYVKASVATSSQMFIFGANAAGNYIDYGAATFNVTTSWTRFTYSFTFSNALVTNIQIRLDGPDSGFGADGTTRPSIWWDGLQLERGSSATTFSPYYNSNGANWLDTSVSKLNFPGTADYITAANTGLSSGTSWTSATTDVLNTDTHSIFFMIRFNSTVTYPNGYTGGWEKIFSYNAGGTDRSPGIWRYPSARLIHWRYDPSNSGTDISLNGTLSNNWGTEFVINTWYYIGVTKNGATATVYCNGTNVGTNTVSNPKSAGTAPIILFENYTASLANLNNLLIYNRVLSDAEVTQNFTAIRSLYGI